MNHVRLNYETKQAEGFQRNKTLFLSGIAIFLITCMSVLFLISPAVFAEENAKVTKKMVRAEKSFEKGDIDKALSTLEQLISKFPEDPRPATRLARYYLDSKLFNDSIRYAEQAFKTASSNEDAKNVLCEAYQGIGQMNIQLRKFEQAEEAYNKMFELCPTDDNKKRMSFLFAQIAKDAMQRKDLSAAISAYEKILEIEPDNQQLYFELYRNYSNNEQKDKALEILKKGVLAFPDDMKLAVALGAMYFQEKKYVEARDFFEKALGNDPDNFHIASSFAQATQSVANQKFEQIKADGLLPKATKTPGTSKKSKDEYNKEMEQVRHDLIALKQKIYHPVIDAFNKAIALDVEQKNQKLLMNLAILYGFIGLEEEMKKTYLTTADIYDSRLESNPDDIDAMHYCAWCLLNAGERFEDAEKMFKKLLELDEKHTHPTALIYLGEILVEQKKYNEAQQCLNTFMTDFPDHPSRSRAELWLNYIDAVLTGTDAGKKPTKMQLTEPVLDLGTDDEGGLQLDDSEGLSEEDLLGN